MKLTKRDLDILRFTMEQKFSDSKQIKNGFFGNVGMKCYYERMKELVDNKHLMKRSVVFHDDDIDYVNHVFQVSCRSTKILASDTPRGYRDQHYSNINKRELYTVKGLPYLSNVDLRTFEHDRVLGDLRLKLFPYEGKSKDLPFTVLTLSERRIRNQFPHADTRIPDMMVFLEILPGHYYRIVLEYEHTFKGHSRCKLLYHSYTAYTGHLGDLASSPEYKKSDEIFDILLILCRNDQTLSAYQRIDKECMYHCDIRPIFIYPVERFLKMDAKKFLIRLYEISLEIERIKQVRSANWK